MVVRDAKLYLPNMKASVQAFVRVLSLVPTFPIIQ